MRPQVWLAKLRAMLRRGAAERDLDREMNSHLTILADEFERRGMSPEQARQEARRAFGSIALAKDLSREARSVVWLE